MLALTIIVPKFYSPYSRWGAGGQRRSWVFRSANTAAAGPAQAGSLARVDATCSTARASCSPRATLSLAMRGLGVRLCKAINRAIGRPRGRVFLDRYHDRILRTPREVRHALAYVLQNARKHGVAPRSAPRGWVDPMSSGPWFDAWRGTVVVPWSAVRTTGPPHEPPMAEPRTWLLRTGWRRYGRIDPWRNGARQCRLTTNHGSPPPCSEAERRRRVSHAAPT
jgi:hypothetical protein